MTQPRRMVLRAVGVGLLLLLKPMSGVDFDTRQVRVIEMMTRHIAYVLQNAYDPSTGLLTRPALEQRALAVLSAGDSFAEHCIAYADVDRLKYLPPLRSPVAFTAR